MIDVLSRRVPRHHWVWLVVEWHRTGRGDLMATTRAVIVTCDLYDDGHEWIHASMSGDRQVPTYEALTLLHQAVFDGGWSYQVFAPPAEHIDIHPHALHLFGRLDGQPALPDFTRGTGSI